MVPASPATDGLTSEQQDAYRSSMVQDPDQLVAEQILGKTAC